MAPYRRRARYDDSFKHKPLDRSLNRPIRLLTFYPITPYGQVKCSISTHELNSAPEYCALSYMWGKVGHSQYFISIDERPFYLRQNLCLFLRYLCSSKIDLGSSLTVWTDAICINQHSVEERNHQVGMMGEIYARAASVIAWLVSKDQPPPPSIRFGTPDMTKWFLIAGTPDYWAASLDLDEAGDLAIKHERRDASQWRVLYHLCENEYWTRTWIIQEILLAKTVTIIYDEQELEWSLFLNTIKSAKEYLSPQRTQKLRGKSSLIHTVLTSTAAEMATFRFSRNRTNTSAIGNLLGDNAHPGISSLIELVQIFGRSKCEILHDRIYALLGLSTDSQHLPVDYSQSPEDLCLAVLLHVKCNAEELRHGAAILAKSLNMTSVLELRPSLAIAEKLCRVSESERRITDRSYQMRYVGKVTNCCGWHDHKGALPFGSNSIIRPIPLGKLGFEFYISASHAVSESLFKQVPYGFFDCIMACLKDINTEFNFAGGFIGMNESTCGVITLRDGLTVARLCKATQLGDLLFRSRQSEAAIVLRRYQDNWIIIGRALLPMCAGGLWRTSDSSALHTLHNILPETLPKSRCYLGRHRWNKKQKQSEASFAAALAGASFDLIHPSGAIGVPNLMNFFNGLSSNYEGRARTVDIEAREVLSSLERNWPNSVQREVSDHTKMLEKIGKDWDQRKY